jgi:type VI secretion system protein ImpM
MAAVPLRVLTSPQSSSGCYAVEVGLFGKLPSHGDFLRRRASDAFVSIWDAWLQDCMAASRSALSDSWLDIYLTSPAWRFAGAAGACGPAPVVGLMVPSVDRVGRYFPLTIVAELPDYVSLITVAREAAPFFDAAERLVIDTLASDPVDFEGFDERVMSLADRLDSLDQPLLVMLDPVAAEILNEDAPFGWQLPTGSSDQITQVFEQLLSQRLSAIYEPLMLWWTEGSSIVEPSCLITQGLPDPDAFTALLDGSWGRHRWRSVPARVETGLLPETPLLEETSQLRFRSTAATDVGRVRESNEDAFVELPERGVWAVADGLGGHSDGEYASRMVCDAFADFQAIGSLEEMIAAARDRMNEVNDHLLRTTASRSLLADRSASTVVALLARAGRCAVLWVGDSRLYRWRTGRLEQLTRDHGEGESSRLPPGRVSHVVTRAVGVHSTLTLDLHCDEVQSGDRFLLCSDGLTRTVPDAEIGALLERQDIRTAAEGLIQSALNAGAPDNVTVIVAEAYQDTSGLP